jgi:hypothetical protein
VTTLGSAASRSATDRRGSNSTETRDLFGSRLGSRLDRGLSLRHRARCSNNDPLTVMLVVDALLNVAPGHEFNAVQLTRSLEAAYPYMLWNARVVSKILSDVAGTLRNAIGVKIAQIRGMSLSAAERTTWSPLYRKRQAEGYRYVVTVTREGWEVMLALRAELQAAAETLISGAAFADYPLGPDVPSDGCPVASGITG